METLLVYRDRLLPKSELGFMRRQYLGFTRLHPLWVGCRTDPGLAEASIDYRLLGRPGPLGALDRALFKQLGVVPRVPPLAALRPALVHAQFGRGGALALPLAQRLGLKLAVTFHGGDAHKDKHYRQGLWRGIYARRLPALINYASLFICVSSSVRDRLLARGFPAAKLLVLPIGVELDTTPPEAAPLAPPYLLFVGRFVEKKGILVLLDALRLLRAQGCTLPLVLVGDGPLLAEVRARAATLGPVVLPGWQSPAQVRAWMAGALCLLVPSIIGRGGDAEGLPSVAVEALGLARPVIGSTAAGLADLLTQDAGGLCVQAGDAAALAAAMAALIGDPARAVRLGAAGRERVAEHFVAERQSAQLESVLLTLL